MKYSILYHFIFCVKRNCNALVLILLVLSLIMACTNNDYTPKPIAYNRIEKPNYMYRTYEDDFFSFEYSDIAQVKRVEGKDSLYWFNILYPQYKAVIYCSYLPINTTEFSKVLEDSYHLAYSHTLMADAIDQSVYNDNRRQIGGVLYQLEGNVATPMQFFITDSVANFLRGSFYYSENLNLDSLNPVTSFIKEDIAHLFQTLKFKTRSK